MKRLTSETCSYNHLNNHMYNTDRVIEAFLKLQAYENTGLEPEEIILLKKESLKNEIALQKQKENFLKEMGRIMDNSCDCDGCPAYTYCHEHYPSEQVICSKIIEEWSKK